MKNSISGKVTFATVTLFALIVAACTPTQTDKQAFGPQVTTAKIAQYFSGNSTSSSSGGAYYASNGSYQSFYYLSEAPNVCTGRWSANKSKLVVKETCKSVSDGKTVSSAPKTSSYAVHIKADGAVRLDERLEDPSAGQRDISKPVEGFPRKAEFTAMQKKIESGQAVGLVKDNELSTAELVIGIPLWIAMCVGTAGFLCI